MTRPETSPYATVLDDRQLTGRPIVLAGAGPHGGDVEVTGPLGNTGQGRGVAWGEHDSRLACGVAAFFRNGYKANLVSSWLPALDGVVARLEAGIAVADVGCGYGHSTLLMAQAFPNSSFHGFDTHVDSIEEARRLAEAAGLASRPG